MTVDTFWRSTIKEIDLTIRAYIFNLEHQREMSAANAWYSAYLARIKMPSLSEFLKQLKPVSHQPDQNIDEKIYRVMSALAGKK